MKKVIMALIAIILLASCVTTKPKLKESNLNEYHKELQVYYQKQQKKNYK